MKSIIRNAGSLLILLIAVLVFNACVEDVDLSKFTPKDPEMSFESGTVNVLKKDSTYTLLLTSNLPWRVQSNVEWITFEKQNGLATDSVYMKVAKNVSLDSRTGKVTAWITDEYRKELIVIQEAGDPLPDVSVLYYVKADGNATADGLTWANATTLDNALALSVSGDSIFIAAGTYTPNVKLNGGTNAQDITFAIYNNVTLVGGFPANATNGAIADPNANPTILSGTNGGTKAAHTVVIAAPIETGRKVTLSGLTIRDGEAMGASTGSVSVNGATFVRNYGGGLVIGKSVVEINDCDITDNHSLAAAAGIYIFSAAHVTFNSCKIRNNSSLNPSGNGGGLWNAGSTVYLYDSEVSNNTSTGVGAGVYSLDANVTGTTYIIRCTITGNKTTGAAASGYYGRENSVAYVINSTISGNESSSHGAGMQIYGAAGKIATLHLISSTITGNSAVGNGGGLNVANANTSINIYNSIISGNTAATGLDYNGSTDVRLMKYSIISEAVYDQNGITVPDNNFDPVLHLGSLTNNGGVTRTHALTGENNPAVTLGMPLLNLQILGANFDPVIPDEIILFDQTGKSRDGKPSIGAVVK